MLKKVIESYLNQIKVDQPKTSILPYLRLDNLFISQIVGLSKDLGTNDPLTPAMAQNWVRRGVVSPPNGKRYSGDQAATLLLIDELRGIITLEEAKKLLKFINGEANTLEDDLVKPIELYNLYAEMYDEAQQEWKYNLDLSIHRALSKLYDTKSEDQNKGKLALSIVILNLLAEANLYREMAQRWIAVLETEDR